MKGVLQLPPLVEAGAIEPLEDFLYRYGGMSRTHRHWSFEPSVPPPSNPMRWQHSSQNTFGQEVCEMCDWNAELHVQREDWADKILLELPAQDFTPVLSIEGWMMQSTSAMTAALAQVQQAKWISLRVVTTWISVWNTGLPEHGLALRSSKDVPKRSKW